MKPNRMYKGKSVEMLMTVSTIVEHAINNQSILTEKRPDWVDPFFPDLQIRIDSAFTNILGVSSVENRRQPQGC